MSMPEYDWSRMFLNMPGFLIWFVILDSIYLREAHAGLYEMIKMWLFKNRLIWYYEYTLEPIYALLGIFQDSEYARDTQDS